MKRIFISMTDVRQLEERLKAQAESREQQKAPPARERAWWRETSVLATLHDFERRTAGVATRDAVRDLLSVTRAVRTADERQGRWMLGLTVALVLLTLWIAALTFLLVLGG